MFIQSENAPAFDPEIHLAPKRSARMSTHWVEVRDIDGQCLHGPDALVWQPGAKTWCRLGFEATGVGGQILKSHGMILCEIPRPDIENNPDILQDIRKHATRVHRKIKEKETLTDEDMEVIRQMCIFLGNPV